jgi:hypothetical protein
MELAYKPPRTIERFMQSNARRRLLTGPFGSGKSSGCSVEVVRRLAERPHWTDGFRHGRAIITRNTTPQLRDTTMKTFFYWFPNGSIGEYRATEKVYYVKIGDIRGEIMFRALDNPDDVKNLLSLEINFAWLNEQREMEREIVDGIDGRLGRWYDMPGAWDGMWGDTNPPIEDTYCFQLAEGLDPDTNEPVQDNGWAVFKQPSGLSKDAENLENLKGGRDYYVTMMKGKSENFIRMYIHGLPGRSIAGKPVQPEFDEPRHVARSPLIVDPARPIVVGMDFGRTPAAVIKQEDVRGRSLTFAEAITLENETMALETFIDRKLRPLLNLKFRGLPIFITGDPSGGYGSQTTEQNCVDILVKGLKISRRAVRLAYTNDAKVRREATEFFLTRHDGCLIDPSCRYLIRGLSGGYHYEKLRLQNAHRDKPEKNIFSHVCEADEYANMHFRTGVTTADDADYRRRVLAQLAGNPGYNVRS